MFSESANKQNKKRKRLAKCVQWRPKINQSIDRSKRINIA